MVLVNSHCHTQFSDGTQSILETARLAKEKEISHLYITDHHIPDDPPWTLDVNKYLREIEKVSSLVNSGLHLHKGVEIDWANGYEKWFETQTQEPFDFILGSVHSIPPERVYAAEIPSEQFKALAQIYFNQIRRLANSGLADSIAHLDLVKLSLDENSDWYREEVQRTLETIAKSGTCIEINTSGVRKGAKEFHPSFWILQSAFQLGIPITMGTDSHRPEKELTYMLPEAIVYARLAGYNQIVRYEDRKRIQVPI